MGQWLKFFLFWGSIFGSTLQLTHASEGRFLLGEDNDKWGVPIPSDGPLFLRIGGRLQTNLSLSYRKEVGTGRNISFQDFFVRRGRFQFEAKLDSIAKFYMDVRNDNANRNDSGEGDFNLGAAYVEVKDVFSVKGLKFRAFRAKVDVSRSETISSSRLIFLNRASVAGEAAGFVSHNRRATNLQFLGIFPKWAFQLVAGDGVQSGSFEDAQGSSLSGGSIDRQRMMMGAKVRVYPISGWEDKKPTETYFGEGKHLSFGAGVFSLNGIEYQNSAGTQVDTVDRSLTNIEFSAHYKNLSLQAEFFRFNGVIQDFSVASKSEGSSSGYYVHSEVVLPSLSYLSVFGRYEFWDRFLEAEGYGQTNSVVGVNWYLKGNKIRVGLAFQHIYQEENLRSADSRGRRYSDDRNLQLTSMWHF